MANINSALEHQLRSAPEQPFKLIVRTDREVAARAEWLAAQGISVRQQFRLTPGVAITCTGAEALNLLEQNWVESVEIDGDVQAW